MTSRLYITPDPANRLDLSRPYEKGIADLLLHFDKEAEKDVSISKIVTVPSNNRAGLEIAACQSFYREGEIATYVFSRPDDGALYQFKEALVPISDRAECFLKAGWRGLFFGAEKKGIVYNIVDTYDEDAWFGVCAQNLSRHDWYHFTGTAEEILRELQNKCVRILR